MSTPATSHPAAKRVHSRSSRRQGHMYVVHYRQHGYARETFYTIEVLRAECQELVHLWTRYEQRGENK